MIGCLAPTLVFLVRADEQVMFRTDATSGVNATYDYVIIGGRSLPLIRQLAATDSAAGGTAGLTVSSTR